MSHVANIKILMIYSDIILKFSQLSIVVFWLVCFNQTYIPKRRNDASTFFLIQIVSDQDVSSISFNSTRNVLTKNKQVCI